MRFVLQGVKSLLGSFTESPPTAPFVFSFEKILLVNQDMCHHTRFFFSFCFVVGSLSSLDINPLSDK